MAAPRSLAFVLVGLTIAGCSGYLPKPEYTYVKPPAPIRVLPDGTRVDDRGYYLDAHGYRLDRNGKLLGEVDYDEKTSTTISSNAVAGYYISSTGTVAAGNVAEPSAGGQSGIDVNSNVTASTSNVPGGQAPPMTTTPSPPAATTTPVPLAPPATR